MIHKNNKINTLTHILVWLVLFSMPYVLSYGQSQEINRIIAHFWIPLASYAIIFYLNYFLFIDRYLFTKKTLLFLVLNLVAIALFITLKEQIEVSCFSELMRKPNNDKGSPPFKMFVYVQMLSYMAPLLFAIAIKTTHRYIKTEAENQEAIQHKLQSELKHLHYQLQPHFFFNSLNNIYSLVDVSPEQAKSSIHSLSKLMRYLLYESNLEKVPLSKEIEFLKKYIDLMKLRVSEKTTVEYSFPEQLSTIQVAPLLFISLIENAFKHGVSGSKESHIKIVMATEDNKILFTIENSNFPKKTDDKSGSGIGLVNLEQRLQLLYPNMYSFDTSVEEGVFLVALEIETA